MHSRGFRATARQSPTALAVARGTTRLLRSLGFTAAAAFRPRAVSGPGGDIWIISSLVTVHEIEKAIALLDRKGAAAKAAGLQGWLSGLIAGYSDKILGLDADTATISGRLRCRACRRTRSGMADAIIAGIAQAYGLTVITRNIRDFVPFGIAMPSPEEIAGHAS